MQIIDISIPLNANTPVWEGDRCVTLTQVSKLTSGADFNVTRIEMGAHAGTHIDAPFHLFKDGATVDAIPLHILVGKAHVLTIHNSYDEISPDALMAAGFKPGIERLLLKTKNSQFWKDDPHLFRRDFIALNRSAAAFLVDQGVRLVGIDYFSVSPISDLKVPHELLLRNNVIILENLYLVEIEASEYQLVCLPLKLTGTDGAPVRAILMRG